MIFMKFGIIICVQFIINNILVHQKESVICQKCFIKYQKSLFLKTLTAQNWLKLFGNRIQEVYYHY